tara:strand:+ start:237 stop:476 length:240 start_codon:yes stop_codon:yes gene_type:complete
MRPIALVFVIICHLLILPHANASEVNGKIKDECKFLLRSIEQTVKYIHSYTAGSEYEVGTYLAQLNLSELIRVHKELCD